MKKIYLLIIVLAVLQDITNAQFVRVWEKSEALNNLPSWFSPTGTRERGIAFSKYNGIPKLYVISNLTQPTVIILNAMTGDSIGTLNTNGINGGLLFLSDISARSSDIYPHTPALYACNLTENATTVPYKIYFWESDTSAPQILVTDSVSAFRLGDHLNLGMDWGFDHYVTVSSNNYKLVDYYCPTGSLSFVRHESWLSDGNTGSNASADYNSNMSTGFGGMNFIVNSDGYQPKFYDSTGILFYNSDPAIISSDNNSIKYYANGTLCCDEPSYATYQYDNNNAALVLSVGAPGETVWGETPSLGNNPNPQNYGDVEYAWIEWNELYVFVLSGNNGIGAYYAPGLALPVELSSFTADNVDGEIILKWQTATETNNSGFEIERKINNENWERIGFIEGHGTTTETHHYSFTDIDVESGKYQYKLKQIDYDGSFEYSDIIELEIPSVNKFSLSQNYPNPFNPTTSIYYQIPLLEYVTLKVYGVLGNEVATLVSEEKMSGSYEVEFNGSSLTSGIYYYKLQAGSFVETKKMILMK